MTFYRLNTDRTRIDVAFDGLFAGPARTACWVIGGGPSLAALPCAQIAASCAPKLCINLSGTRLLRPTLWTSYDPSARFHRSIYLDAGVMKFVHARRAMDLVPETSFKVCDCPNTYFFDRDSRRGFADFLSPDRRSIVDWADSLVQAIDIACRLGFRMLYLAGCEMRVWPSEAQIARAAEAGVDYRPHELLTEFLRRCAASGISAEELDQFPQGPHYHFDETKKIRAAAQTELHYFRIAQYLRLSRRSLSLAGVELISVTPDSRLNDYFPYLPAEDALTRIARDVGCPSNEPTRGLYTQTVDRQPVWTGPMRDYRPPNWSADGEPPIEQQHPARPEQIPHVERRERDAEFLIEAEGIEARRNEERQTRSHHVATELKRMAADPREPNEVG
jgi:hypothetical protein